MKILLIGHSVFDTIVIGENIRNSPGGIFYTARQIEKLSSSDDEIFLVTQIDKNTQEYFLPVYSKLNLDFVEPVQSIPSVQLIMSKVAERKETYKNISSKLKLDKIDFSMFDGILINMITGNDIDIYDLRNIRSQSKGVIYFDVHTLSRPMNESGKRVFEVIEKFDDWAENIDILQANESEFRTLGKFTSETEMSEHLLSLGIKIILLTKGSRGAIAYFMKDNEVMSFFISAKEIENTNTVGCGDVFGASFFYNYIRNKNVYQSLSFAVNSTENFLSEKH